MSPAPFLSKVASGVAGLDSILHGGFPRNRATLVCGGPGCGKTLLAMQFLVAGASQGSPGVFLAFEEDVASIAANFNALPWSLDQLRAQGMIEIESIGLRREDLATAGVFDLSGLFSRIEAATSGLRAHRLVLDGLDELFSAFDDTNLVRGELRRLIQWLGMKELTSIITAEQGAGNLTRNGFEEYASDCVLALQQDDQESSSVSRKVRVVKYRGSGHAKDWFPFVISGTGLSVAPVTSVALEYEASTERVSSGIQGLDEMLGGEGYYRGSAVLISGTAGTGKTTFAIYSLAQACAKGERAFYLGFEESPSQLTRDLRSIGLNLSPYLEAGLLGMRSVRTGHQDLESHLLEIVGLVDDFAPSIVAFDPMSAFAANNDRSHVGSFFVRIIHFLKDRNITTILTDLITGGNPSERSSSEISSISDTWILLRDQESGAERNRLAYVLKSRGMQHSNQLREYRMTDIGVEFADPYLGPGRVLTGAARMEQAATNRRERAARTNAIRKLESAIEKQDGRLSIQLAELEAEHAERKRTLLDELEALQSQESTSDADDLALRTWRYGLQSHKNDKRG